MSPEFSNNSFRLLNNSGFSKSFKPSLSFSPRFFKPSPSSSSSPFKASTSSSQIQSKPDSSPDSSSRSGESGLKYYKYMKIMF